MKKLRRQGNSHAVRGFIHVHSPFPYVYLNDAYHNILEGVASDRVRC